MDKFNLDVNVRVIDNGAMNKSSTYYIGDISQSLGLSQRTVRYYEEMGIIKPNRTDGGFRTYSERDLELLRMVIQFKDLGMSLEEIGSLLAPGREPLSNSSLSHIYETLKAKRTEFEVKINQYNDGIMRIDRILVMLSNCPTCGNSTTKSSCESCLKEHGGDLPPMVGPNR